MKNPPFRIKVAVITVICSSVVCGKAQDFANLNFEAGLGSPVDNSYDFYTLPDWNVTIIGDQNGAIPGGVIGVGSPRLTDFTYGYIVPP